MHLFSLTSCLHFLLFDLVWSLVPFLVIKLIFKRPERLIYWRRIPSHSGRAGCSLTVYPAWALWIVSVTVIVPLAVDMDMTWIILKSLQRSWVCPFPGQPVVPLKFLDLELFSVMSWMQHHFLDVVGCA